MHTLEIRPDIPTINYKLILHVTFKHTNKQKSSCNVFGVLQKSCWLLQKKKKFFDYLYYIGKVLFTPFRNLLAIMSLLIFNNEMIVRLKRYFKRSLIVYK